ncbi:unnamed protein product [Dovyalis caffra]|uniref:Uncharacterized protein n=2 Tax=Dovyalis caffra TaxID=77055 RepID=A0AAV1QNG3_9ROSI|nr:unnamed protein product [Dovyalis caffra]
MIDRMKTREKELLLNPATSLDASLVQGHKELSSLDAKFSRLSEEEEKLEVEIQRLIAKKEELLDHKNSVASQFEKTNEKVSKDLAEWKNLEEEIKRADDNWYGGKERLAQANTSWQLFKERLELTSLSLLFIWLYRHLHWANFTRVKLGLTESAFPENSLPFDLKTFLLAAGSSYSLSPTLSSSMDLRMASSECKPEGLELLDVAQCCYNLTTKKLCLELQPLRVGHGATASDAPHHCEKRGLAHQPTLPRVSVARTGSEIQRIAAKGGMIAARCKPEVTSGGPASKAHYPDYPNEMIEAGLHLELLWLPHTPTSPCNFHFKSTPKSIHQRATLTAKRAEQLELDERRGCNFKEARPDPRTGQKTGPTTGVGNFLKHARLPRVLVSALTLSLKWLSNLSMGNRGFLPGLLADACKYFLPALGRGYRHWPRTKNSLKPRYWIEQEARNLSLLLVLPSLWLTGFSSHTSGGGGRRVQLPLEIGNLFLELPLILGSQLLGGIWLLWNDQEGMVEESHWKLEDARLLILSGVSSSSSIVDGLREHHLVWQHLSVTLTNAFEEICNVELEGVESAVQQVETRKMIREECDDGEQLILSRLPELKASKSLSFLVGSFFLAVFLLSSSSHSLVAKRIHSRKKEILYYTTNTVCNGNLKPKELARMDGLVSKQPDSLAQSHRSWISFGQNRRLERLQRGYEDEGLLGLEWSLFRVWVKDWLKSNVSGTLSPDVSIQQFFLAPILCRSWKSIRTDKQFVRFGLKGKVYDMVAVKALDEGSGLTLSFLIIEVTR